MALDNNFIDDLKSRVNIVDVIGREVSLKRAGSNYKGLCPFHNEKTPSFMVSEQKQIFNCFGCGEKGDVIKFVERFYNLSFMEAVEKLCEDNNIEMPQHGGGPRIDYDKYYEINRKAAKYFFDNMKIHGNEGYAYIRKRGLTDETIAKFGIGFAPDGWTGLYDHLHKEGVSDEDMLKLGLVSRGKKSLYDKFRRRVMFPIFNTTGKLIGFGGRAVGDDMPKYLNSAESEIFLKKNNLYGLNFSKKDIDDNDKAVLVEGYMDAISLFQNGVRNVVASLGTALTENQARLLERYTKNIILSYDSDSAGIKAALRGIDIIRSTGGKAKILRIDDGKDPDEFVKKNGKEAFEKLIDNAVPSTDFKLSIARKGYDFNDDRQVLDYISKAVPILRSLGPVEQDIYIRKLAEEFGISEHAIGSEVRTENKETNNRQRFDGRQKPRREKRGDPDEDIRIELLLLAITIQNTNYLRRLNDDGIEFRTTLGRKIMSIVAAQSQSAERGDVENEKKKIYEALDPDEETVTRNIWENLRIGPDDEEFYLECRASYRSSRYRDKKAELLNDMAVAEKMDKREDLKSIAAELMEIEELIRKG